jgi:acetyl-CoA acyltransferase
MSPTDEVAIVGAGMIPFGKHMDESLKALGADAVRAALADAGLPLEAIDSVFVANAMSAVVTGQVSVVGQTIMREMGMRSTPVWNIDNACASSSSAVTLAVNALRAGAADHVLVLGVEKLYTSSRAATYRAINGAADVELREQYDVDLDRESFFVKAVYPERLRRYESRYGLDARTLAEISVKNRANAHDNPVAQYREPMTVDEVLGSRVIVEPLHALMCAPIGDGAAAVILTTRRHLTPAMRPVWVRASEVAMGGDPGGEPVRELARRAYTRASIEPARVDLAEVNDSISFNELKAYEDLLWCGDGEGASYLAEGTPTATGARPVNTSGGLESRGHPIAATGAAQLVELTQQLRGESGSRQVDGARWGIAENLGGFARDDTAAIAITILEGER